MKDFLLGLIQLVHELDTMSILVLLINVLLMAFAERIVKLIFGEADDAKRKRNRVHVFRILNLLILFSYGYYQLYLPTANKGLGLQLVSVFVVLYLGYLSNHILAFLIRQKFGKMREVNGKKAVVETYNSRLLGLLSGVFVFVIVLISVIQILGLDDQLRAGGVIGFIGVFLALTQATWAPDIFGGLIILNSGIVEEGDVIEISGSEAIIGIVFKTKIFHTEILNIVNNHRVMIRNTKLRDYFIHNLSKFASAKGMRENLHFKIGYEIAPIQVREMFNEAFMKASGNDQLAIEPQYPLEIGMKETGDHAVEWVICYYTKEIKKLIATRQQMREIVLDVATRKGISLATPITHSAQA